MGDEPTSGVEVIVSSTPDKEFNRTRFDEADKAVVRGTNGGYTDSRDIEYVIDQINHDVFKQAAKIKSSFPLVRKLWELYWTVTSKSAEDIVEELQGDVSEITRENEMGLKSINARIIQNIKKEKTLQAKISRLGHDIDTYDYATDGYALQSAEIKRIIDAYAGGQDPQSVVHLKALSADFYKMSFTQLSNELRDIESKQRTAGLELVRLRGSHVVECKKLESTQAASKRLIGQFYSAYGTHTEAIMKQISLIPEGYLDSTKLTLEISKRNERLEKAIKKKNQAAGAYYSGLEQNVEILNTAYKPDFGNDDDIQRSKEAIDARFNEENDEGMAGVETLTDLSKSYRITHPY